MLAQGSDFVLALDRDEGVEYALLRLNDHLRAAQTLARVHVGEDNGPADLVAERERQWPVFARLDASRLRDCLTRAAR